jgi:hypothetical protein
MELRLAPLRTARLRLEPLAAETARAILAGYLSGLAAAGLTWRRRASPTPASTKAKPSTSGYGYDTRCQLDCGKPAR